MMAYVRFGRVTVLLGCLFISLAAQAQRQTLTDIAPIDADELMRRISEESLVEIKQKYADLQKNFTPHFLTTGLDLDCRTGGKAPLDGRTFSGLRVDNQSSTSASTSASKSTSTPLIETRISISHYDCFARLVFVERISITAPTTRPMTVEQAVKFRRFFQATGDEVYRGYQVENAEGKAIFETRSQRTETANTVRHFTLVQFAGKDWLRIDQIDSQNDERKLRLRVYSGEFSLDEGNFTYNFGAPSLLFELLWNPERLIHEIEGKEVSQLKFDENLQELVIRLSALYMKAAYSSFIPNLPKTVKVSSGVADSPFLRELQLNYNRVLTKTEDAQVRRFFERTIRDIKEGRIKVE